MNRRQLEHVVRAAAGVAAADDVVVVGSQAILGAFPDAPAELLVSMEADVYPLHAADRADLIDGSIGELSPFHETFGYYAHGVSPETAILPDGWRSRLVKVANENTGGATGWCLSPADLAVSKLAAGPEKDVAFVSALLGHGMVAAASVLDLLAGLPADTAAVVRARLARLAPGAC
jgi:hypothetical protein